ncbi:MetQ/NlpA family lipoprotein [Exercitatus varius]|uniref:MetQ/NlpA family lipoprotein n=1 Tax=Exercitatus varius TaxID=67857 RepID=UPI00294B8D5D|nr:MetQ/NlpA family lipoprotein [Exercitatus varius]MDG2940788.1 MetQ/NlpA family lipoprotein [Exercitatus varius]
MNFKKLLSVLALTSVFALTACKDDSKLKVGVMAGPEHQMAEIAAKVAKDKYKLDVELVSFTDYSQPNAALFRKDLDVNAIQHKPYLDEDMAKGGYKDLVIVGNTFVYPIAGYSKKIKSLAELQDGATVAIPNDPTNQGRSLALLEKQGLIKLKDSNNILSTPLDVVENPKNLKFNAVEGALLPRVLDDVDLAVINNNFAGQIGLSPKDGIFVEDKDSPYVNIIVAREDNKDTQTVKDFVKAYQSEEVYQEAVKHFKDGVVKGW